MPVLAFRRRMEGLLLGKVATGKRVPPLTLTAVEAVFDKLEKDMVDVVGIAMNMQGRKLGAEVDVLLEDFESSTEEDKEAAVDLFTKLLDITKRLRDAFGPAADQEA